MRGGTIIPLIVAWAVPLLVLIVIVSGIGFGLVAWQPPVQWTQTFGGVTGGNAAAGITAASSAVYLVGYANYSGISSAGGNLLLSKYESTSAIVWSRSIGNSSLAIAGFAVGAYGLYLTGSNSTSESGYVEKFDLSGNKLWSRNSSIITGGVSVTTGGVYIAGEPLVGHSDVSAYDLNGNPVWTSSLINNTGVTANVYSNPSGVYIVGNLVGTLPGQISTGGSDAFLVKYSSGGTLVWARQFGSGLDDWAYSVSGDSSGVYVSGTTYLGRLPGFGWLRKYDFNGNLDWVVRIDSPDSSGAGDSSISAGTSGVYLSLSTAGLRNYLMKFDLNSGHQLWSFQVGSPSQIYGVGTAFRVATYSDTVYIAGSTPINDGTGFVSQVSSSPSLILFRSNPPWSFIILGGLVGGSVVGVLVLRNRRRQGMVSRHAGPSRKPSQQPNNMGAQRKTESLRMLAPCVQSKISSCCL